MLSSLLTKQDVADYLKADTRTVQRLMATGKVSSMKIGRLVRFDPAKLTKELARLERPAQTIV